MRFVIAPQRMIKAAMYRLVLHILNLEYLQRRQRLSSSALCHEQEFQSTPGVLSLPRGQQMGRADWITFFQILKAPKISFLLRELTGIWPKYVKACTASQISWIHDQ